MRTIPFITSTIITLLLIILLNKKWGSIPPLGKFLSPQQGFWQNAEPADHDFTETLSFDNLKGTTSVYLDDRLVPHIFAEQDEDAYFVQGFLHAKFRLWQMDFQSMAAAGRISEVLGNDPNYIRYDREQRRMGMVYGAGNALKAVNADPFSKKVYDAYTAGVNAFIASLTESSLPLEYKLLDYKPEKWSNLKIALFIKLMSRDLAGPGYARDLQLTNAKAVFSQAELNILYPQLSDSSRPIVPPGTLFDPPAVTPVIPATADSLYFDKDTTVHPPLTAPPVRLNGSNNWAVSGQRTKSGAPIFCNDPHLGLTLPAIWHEMQITTPTMNNYGVTFPSIPGVVIGFNDSIAFGFTNAGRDIMDFYQVRFKDASKKEYWYDGKWTPCECRIEEIKIRGSRTYLDTVAYTVFGPVMYDDTFTTVDSATNTALALRWVAHDPSNEVLMWLKLNRAKNYNDYLAAIKEFSAPGQNMLFASKAGDIAIWQQARFPARWQGQGLYIMPGEDSTYKWQGFIPQEENPHLVNPASGFIQSANQRPVDSAYPYFIPGDYFAPRSISINNKLEPMQQITPQDMMRLQNDSYDAFAATAVPLLLKYAKPDGLSSHQRKYLNLVKQWDFYTASKANAATVFKTWWDSLEVKIWNDEFLQLEKEVEKPEDQTLLELLLRDSALKYVDDITTPEKETLQQQVLKSLQAASVTLEKIEKEDSLTWWKHKNTTLYHLLRKSVMPFARPGLETGGGKNAINAMTHNWGPSWRLIVHLTTPAEAYGVYPGGQSGNPGSRYYDSFVDTWAAGKYYKLWMMNESEKGDKRIKWKMTFANS